ncbi:MAG TPA: ParM/StbA family protein [Desulfonatronum sp.]|nr:ParM/StbA family protein [Desulfonatronum sp.]
MDIIGIDVGFGFTKAYNGKNSVIFKSIIGDASDIQFHSVFTNSSPSSNLHITLDDKSYFLGSYAELQSSIREFTLDQDRLLQNYFKILAVAAAGLCTDSFATIQVVSGLPVAYLKRDTRKLMEAIAGVHQITFHHIDGKSIKKSIKIDKISIIPQPIGSIFNLIFDEEGRFVEKSLATQKVGVVDVGFKTTDLSIFDHLQYIERGSTTMDTGISKCFSIIAGKLRQESNINIELFRMFKFMESGVIKIRGKEYNISGLKKKIYEHTAAAIAADLSRLWENDWDMDSIVLTGGGSVELADYLAGTIEGNLIPVPKNLDARFNNVQGYYKFGRHKWGHGRLASGQASAEKAKEEQKEKAEPSAEKQAMPELNEEKAGTPSKGLSWLRRKG